jgi:hypothetical protein
VQLLNGSLGHATIVVVDEREATGPARLAVRRDDDLHGIADRAEVLPDVDLGCAVREIADE